MGTNGRAVIYCRVSTKEQVQNLSLPTQLRACREYCKREGFEVAEEFEDAGESAKTTDRPEFQRLIQYCRNKNNRVRVVVVFNITRFSRNVQDHALVRGLLVTHGVGLRSVNERIGEDSAGRLLENMLAAVGQFENDQKSERTKAGMLEALRRGRWAWQAPLGYLNGDSRAGEPSFKPDPVRAPLIRQAFQLAASGRYSAADVLRTVTTLGLLTRKGTPLTAQTFSALLRNPIYAGLFESKGLGVSGLRGDFEPLVSEALFHRTRRALAREAPQSHVLNNPDFPLRRFVICDLCSTPLTGSSPKGRTRRYPYYHCRKCAGVCVPRDVLENRFVAVLKASQLRPEFVRLFGEVVLDVWETRRRDGAQTQQALQARISELERRETLLETAFLYEGKIDRETYERQRGVLRDALTMARLEFEDARGDDLDVEALLRFSEDVLCNSAQVWVEALPEQKQRLQATLFPEGLRIRDGKFGTVVTSLPFKYFGENNGSDSGLASPTEIDGAWKPLDGWLAA